MSDDKPKPSARPPVNPWVAYLFIFIPIYVVARWIIFGLGIDSSNINFMKLHTNSILKMFFSGNTGEIILMIIVIGVTYCICSQINRSK